MRLQPVERRGGVAQLALAAVETALGAADTAEIEPQHGIAPPLEGLVHRVDDLVVHRPPMLRIGMEDDGNGRGRLPAGLIARFDAPFRSVDDHFRHLSAVSQPRWLLTPNFRWCFQTLVLADSSGRPG